MTTDLEHASRKTSPSEDLDLPAAPSNRLDPLLLPFEELCNPPIICNMWDQVPLPNPNYLQALQQCLVNASVTDACRTSSDASGNTVLHLAAKIPDSRCIEWILDQDFGRSLLHVRNRRGETPLEKLEFELEKLRTQKRLRPMMIVPVSDNFVGYDENAVRCLVLLKQLGTLESLQQSGDKQVLRQLTGGCTCGKCLRGVISPRMLHALLTQAELGHDRLADDSDFCLGLEWEDFEREDFLYLPARIQHNLKTNKSMRSGFANLWKHIAVCLQRAVIPSASNVSRVIHDANEWPPVTKNFMDRGGTVVTAFLAICRNAMDQDEWLGDGEYQNMFAEEIANLPKCRNDLEFALACAACGYRRITL